MDFLKGKETEGLAKVFKAGNSEAIRLTKKDTSVFQVKPGDQVVKEISPDGMSITFKRVPKVSENVKKQVDDILSEDADLIQALKDL
jgi:antitoxin component of MazEF toxin-antitoxin module